MIHKSVLLTETIDLLHISPDGIYLDATVGGGGHTAAIAERLTTGHVIGLDCDDKALAIAAVNLNKFGSKVKLVHSNFSGAVSVLNNLSIDAIDGAIFDLGVSSFHLDSPERGFSFRADAPLDMRMDQRLQTTAGDLINTLSTEELTKIFYEFGEEKFAKRIAQTIHNYRVNHPICTTLQLTEIIKTALPKAYIAQSRTHFATRIFQALRIAVNNELGVLNETLAQVWDLLKINGRIAVISFHSLEDRIVKEFFRDKMRSCICPSGLPICACKKIPEAKLYKLVTPSESEMRSNPRSRSAKLRVAEKLAKRQ
jgi:16S rRNA (cytosine1402-N4)-methyltransferase